MMDTRRRRIHAVATPLEERRLALLMAIQAALHDMRRRTRMRITVVTAIILLIATSVLRRSTTMTPTDRLPDAIPILIPPAALDSRPTLVALDSPLTLQAFPSSPECLSFKPSFIRL